MNEELARAQHKQLERLAGLESRGEKVGGWKLGLTSGESRDAFGPGIRPFGFILVSRILTDGDRLSWSTVGSGGIENEVCFVIASDVTEPITAATAIDHIEGVAPAFEINQRRIDRASSPADRITDGLANWGIVLGAQVPVPDKWNPEALTVTLSHGEREVASVQARGHIDNHFDSLATLANQLIAFGRHLRRGEAVITGAYGRQAQPEPGLWTGDFGPELGRVSVTVTEG